jgi:hypothetical protein
MRAAWCLIGGLGCALALPGEALAVERQQHLGVSAGGTVMSTNGGTTPFGWNLGLHYTYGLWDAVNLVVEADASGFGVGTAPKNPAPEPGIVATGGVGLMYVFDVLRWVPYAGGIAGAGYFGGGWLGSPFVTLDLQLAAGLDYQITRTWTVGAAYRQHFFVTEMSTYPEFTSVGLRFEYVWGW